VLKAQLCISLGLVTGMSWNEVSRFYESINNHTYGIIFAGSQRQTHDEIHIDVFPLSGRSIQWLQQTGRSEMICLDPLTSVAFCNVASSLTLHSCPPKLRFSGHCKYWCCQGEYNTWMYELHKKSSFVAPGYVE
jgi:hypothetical protein